MRIYDNIGERGELLMYKMIATRVNRKYLERKVGSRLGGKRDWERYAQYLDERTQGKRCNIYDHCLQESPANGSERCGYVDRTAQKWCIPATLTPSHQEVKQAYLALTPEAMWSLVSPLNTQLNIPKEYLDLTKPFEIKYLKPSLWTIIRAYTYTVGVPVPEFKAIPPITVDLYSQFVREMDAIFRKEFGIGVRIFSGFIYDPEKIMIDEKFVFVENPFVGNMALHSPAHLLQLYTLFMLAKQRNPDITHQGYLDVLKSVLEPEKSGESFWIRRLDVFESTLSCPHYIGNILMSSPNMEETFKLQTYFRGIYILGIRGLAARLGVAPEEANVFASILMERPEDVFPGDGRYPRLLPGAKHLLQFGEEMVRELALHWLNTDAELAPTDTSITRQPMPIILHEGKKNA